MTTPPRHLTAGFIGLGQMGAPMAANILKGGHPLVAYDLNAEKVDRLVGLGAQSGLGPADVARRARFVVSMVDTTAQAEEVILGPGGIAEGAEAGDVILSMSTIDPTALKRIHAQLSAKGIDIIDAPVSGMEKGAREGTLKAFVGGSLDAVEKARPVLESMTSEILHFGSIGQGTVMKLINNMLVQVGWVLVAEALVLGTKAGLDPKQMVETIGKATGNSTAFQYSAPRILARNFDGIRMDISYKDMELQSQLAKALKMPLFMGNLAQTVYEMARASGLGSEDGGAAVVKVYEQLTGVTVAAT